MKPEMSKLDQVRAIGAKICRFANGTSCLCLEKDRTLCGNIKAVALECWDLAHQVEMSRPEFNQANKYSEALSRSGPPKGPKRVRRG